MKPWELTELPLDIDLETKRGLKALPSAHAVTDKTVITIGRIYAIKFHSQIPTSCF